MSAATCPVCGQDVADHRAPGMVELGVDGVPCEDFARLPCGHPPTCDPARGSTDPGATHGCTACEAAARLDVEDWT